MSKVLHRATKKALKKMEETGVNPYPMPTKGRITKRPLLRPGMADELADPDEALLLERIRGADGRLLTKPAEVLTAKVAHCTNWKQVNALYMKHGKLLTHVTVSAMLTHVSRVAPLLDDMNGRDAQQLEALVDRLLALSRASLQQHGPQELSNNVSALGRMGLQRRDYLLAVSENSITPLPDFTPQQLAAMAWGMAKVAHFPGSDWLQAWQDSEVALMEEFEAVDLANSLWALAKWSSKPREDWLDAFNSRCAEQLLSFTAQHVSMVLWSHAVLNLDPDPGLFDALMLEAQVKFPSFTPQGLAMVGWAVCWLNHRPSKLWLEDWVGHVAGVLSRVDNAHVLTNITWALSNWQHRPSGETMAALAAAAVRFLPRMSAHGVCILLLGFADLQYSPPPEWVGAAVEAFHRRRREASGKATAASLWALSRFLRPAEAGADWRVPRDWLARYRPVLSDLVEVLSQHMDELETTDLVDAAIALADLNFFPGETWMGQHERACNRSLSSFTGYQLLLLKKAYFLLKTVYESDMEDRAARGTRGGRGTPQPTRSVSKLPPSSPRSAPKPPVPPTTPSPTPPLVPSRAILTRREGTAPVSTVSISPVGAWQTPRPPSRSASPTSPSTATAALSLATLGSVTNEQGELGYVRYVSTGLQRAGPADNHSDGQAGTSDHPVEAEGTPNGSATARAYEDESVIAALEPAMASSLTSAPPGPADTAAPKKGGSSGPGQSVARRRRSTAFGNREQLPVLA